MVKDPRALTKLQGFFLQWLKIDQAREIVKDPKSFPEFDEKMVSDLRTSLDLSLADVLGSEAADYRQLLLAKHVYLNGRLAALYGAKLPADAPFQKVSFEQEGRAGLLTHPYLMASFAYTSTSSPIHRGVFIARSVLGRVLRPPPEAVAPLAADIHPILHNPAASFDTNRARILPVVPRDDQSLGIYLGAFRRRRSIPKGREGQAHRRQWNVRDAIR